LLQSFKGFNKSAYNVDMDEQQKEAENFRQGSKREALSYLEKEIGSEIEISWMTSVFFMKF
jgi:hypothetical protein